MNSPNSKTSISKPAAQSVSSRNLLGGLTAIFYSLFTLLPDSHSLMVAWPWVFVWQVGLLCPALWLLGLLWRGHLCWLGNRLDWVAGILVVGLIIAAGRAEFPMQARWYSWAGFCFVAALYALSSWLTTADRRSKLLTAQGYLNIAFILVSLGLWATQTLLPELGRLQDLKQSGVNLSFDFSILQLRNWAPIGHQNYVAGYLVLALPLLFALGVLRSGWQRWFWFGGVGLCVLDLYTTSSRAGWLGILLLAIVALGTLLWCGSVPRLWLGIAGGGGLLVLIGVLLTNNRLRTLVTRLFNNPTGGELAYRLITMTTGWRMGISHLWSGVGPGGVPLLYQSYRPEWAGREAELAYQLHSTPAQMWAEMGLWAVLLTGGAIGLLTYLSIQWVRRPEAASSTPRPLILSLLSGLLAYSIVSLTDYQLDNVAVSGTLVVFLATLAAEFRQPSSVPPMPPNPFVPLAGVGILLAAIVWLLPIHRAWLLSSQAFTALNRGNINTFAQQLKQAYQLTPWEPYYSYQLGWNLGNLSLQAQNPQERQQLLADGIAWFQQGIQDSPHQEFGHTNLAWLVLSQNPTGAAQGFARSAQLIPAKRGVFYGLGLSLLAQGNTKLALDAMTLEALRDPLLITSPIWKLPQLQPIAAQLLDRLEARYTTLLASSTSPTLTAQLHQMRGGIRWWQGNLPAAREDWQPFGSPLTGWILDLSEGKSPGLKQAVPSKQTLTIAAWLDAANRQSLLQQAWIQGTRSLPPAELLQQLTETMSRSPTFDQWLKQNAPSRQYRRERAGFGVLSRHIDGPIPVDFLTVVENIPMTQLFEALLPSLVYAPELDMALEGDRATLLKKVLAP